MNKRYNQSELEKILRGIESEIPLNKLKIKNRTPCGIAYKLLRLSEQYPDIWNPEKIREYTRKEIKRHRGNVKGQKRRYYLKHRDKIKEQKRRYYLKHRTPHAIWLRENRNRINWEKFRAYLTELLNNYTHRQDFAAEMATHPSQLSGVLSGKTLPSYKLFRKLAERENLSYEVFEELFATS